MTFSKCFFAFLLLVTCLTLAYHILYSNPSKTTIIKLIVSNQTCDPIYRDNNIYSVLIDNISYPQSVPFYIKRSLNFACLNKTKRHTILFWNRPWWWRTDNIFGACPISNCDLIFDKRKLNQSDLVLVHLFDKKLEMPKRSDSNQHWVMALYESPQMMAKMLNNTWWNSIKLNEYFNLTSTYRIDSDFPVRFLSLKQSAQQCHRCQTCAKRAN